jgi:hypothetical protein
LIIQRIRVKYGQAEPGGGCPPGANISGGIKMAAMTANDVLKSVKEKNVKSIHLQFTDVVGIVKGITIPNGQLEVALDTGVWFDGSSIQGFARIAESDMYLLPDPSTFRIIPWESTEGAATARIICDVYTPDGDSFPGDPRYVLKQAVKKAEDMGFLYNTGPELEFFLFHYDENGAPALLPHDKGGYFDYSTDQAISVRKEMVSSLQALGIAVEASHHEVAMGQHEIDFKYADAVTSADNACSKLSPSSTACTRPSCRSLSLASTARACTSTKAWWTKIPARTSSLIPMTSSGSLHWPSSILPGSYPMLAACVR